MSASPNKYDLVQASDNRVAHRIHTITSLLEHKELKDIKIKSYLDLGCGDASISNQLAKSLNTTTNYFADVCLPEVKNDDTIIDDVTINYIQITESSFKLDIPDNSVDLITCLCSIHHFKNLVDIMSELSRISHSQTILILREHDATEKIQPYLDFIHLVYLIQKDLPTDTFYANYYKRGELQKNLGINGWKYITSEEYKYNPQCIYTSAFIWTGSGNKWLTPSGQTTNYNIPNGKLLKYVYASKDKTIFIKFLKHQKYSEIDAIKLLDISSIEKFAIKLKETKKIS
jgi:ubiquinone/menaquinone biosynthesis C-methylase UbiE